LPLTFRGYAPGGGFTGIVLLKTSIFRFRNLSTEDENPAWRIADVGSRLFSVKCFFYQEMLLAFQLFFHLIYFLRLKLLSMYFY
jgi:hypothetical protein